MTVKELFKKVENYNEICDLMGGEKVDVCLTAGFFFTIYSDNFKDFQKQMKERFADFAYKEIMALVFEPNETQELEYTDVMGNTFVETVEFSVWRKW